jgi:cytochrome d ubiquinol oxidase subunit I
VQGVLKTAEAVGPVPAGAVAASLTTYLVLYAVLLVAYVSVVFHLAAQAAAGNIPRERTRLDNPMQPVGA